MLSVDRDILFCIGCVCALTVKEVGHWNVPYMVTLCCECTHCIVMWSPTGMSAGLCQNKTKCSSLTSTSHCFPTAVVFRWSSDWQITWSLCSSCQPSSPQVTLFLIKAEYVFFWSWTNHVLYVFYFSMSTFVSFSFKWKWLGHGLPWHLAPWQGPVEPRCQHLNRL